MRALIPLLLVACTPEKDGSAGGTDGSTGSTTLAGPCADGGWGGLEDAGALLVGAEGSDDGDGSLDAPFASVEAALAASRAGGGEPILVGPGTFSATLELDDGDDGLALLGCGPDETVLEAEDDGAPVLKVSGTVDLELGQLSTLGGTRALWIWQGAEATLRALRVEGSGSLGIVFDGSQTVVSGEDVEVLDPTTSGGAYGYGILVSDASLSLEGGAVQGATGAGVVATGVDARLSLADLWIEDTGAYADDSFGRGVQVQDQAQATLSDLQISGSRDAGVFISGSYQAILSGVVVSDTRGATLESGESSGDGIVVRGGEGSVSWYPVELDGNVVDGSQRAGILVDGVTATLTANSVGDSGYDPGAGEVLAQGGAVVDGDGAYVLEDEGETALELRIDSLDLDPLEP